MLSHSVEPSKLQRWETRQARIHAPRCRLIPSNQKIKALGLRQAEQEDADAIAALEASHGGWTCQHVQDEISREISRVVVAVDNNCIVGWITVWCLPPFESQIIQITVCPKHQRRGIATQLLEHMIGTSAALGINTMVLEVREDNTAARRLYEKVGFKDVGLRKHYYKDGSHAVLMERACQ